VSDAIVQASDCAFPKQELDRRVVAAQKSLERQGLDLLLTSSPENIFYLTGQQTPGYYTFQCLGLPAVGKPFLLIRRLESYNARANSYLDDIASYDDDANPADAVASHLVARGWRGKRVAIDKGAWFLTVNLHDRLVAGFQPLLDGAGIVEPLRRVKSPIELDFIEKAAAINDIGMRAGIEAVRQGATDNDLVAAIMGEAIRAGSEYVGMEPLVNTGARSGIPHATWRRKIMRAGEPAVLESSATYNRYHATLYRTCWLGPPPEAATAMMAACQAALVAALDALRPGRTCADVHNAAQAVIDKAGYTENYRKRSGYSIGISFAPDWGEGNIMSLYKGVDIPIEANMAFHIPIAMRVYGDFTVAVSETAIVTNGAPRTLSQIPREIVVK
jgi:Xaa-Pro dipeptidase